MSDFTFQIVGDAGKANQATDGVLRRLHALEVAAGRSGGAVNAQMKRMAAEAQQTTRSFEGLARAMKTGLALGGLGVGARELLQIADGYQNIQNRLRYLAGGDMAKVNSMFSELQGIASRTRADLSATAESFVSVSLATKQMGLSQSETLRFTESLNKAVALSGASGAAASAGMIQLSQGLASGALRGDEFNSVMEQIPVVADVIGAHLGKTRGELRAMSKDGKLTADVIVSAFKKAGDTLDKDFGNTVPTITQSLTQLKNELVTSFGPAIQASAQLVIKFANAVNDMNGHLGGMHIGLGTAAGFMLGGPFGAAIGTVIESATRMSQKSDDLVNAWKTIRAEGEKLRAENERLFAGIDAGTIKFEHLRQMGHSVAQSNRIMAEASIAAVERGRQALEDFTRAGDIAVARAQIAIAEFAKMGDWRRIKPDLDLEIGKVTVKNVERVREQIREQLDLLSMFRARAEVDFSASRQGRAEQGMIDRIGESGDAMQTEREREVLEVLRAIETPAEKYVRAITRLNELYQAGAIDADAFAKRKAQIWADTPMAEAAAKAEEQRVKRLTESFKQRVSESRREMEQLAAAIAPVGNALRDMFKSGEFEARRFSDALVDMSFNLAALALDPGGGAGSAIVKGLLGGNRYGGDHVIQGRPVETFGLPRAQFGADWRIGGPPGPDKTLVAFWGSRDESVHVRTPQQRAAEQGRQGPVVLRPKFTVQMPPERRDIVDTSNNGKRNFVMMQRQLGKR